jgi:hypothetical protein
MNKFIAGIFCLASIAQAEPLDLNITWEKNILTISGENLPGGKVEIWYLEAFCRPGSTDREWNESVIPHTTRLIEVKDDKKSITLESELSDGVIVTHTIKSEAGTISFDLIAKNPTATKSEAHWAQPCIRVGEFTGTQQIEDKYAYLPNSFIFVNGERTFFPFQPWATKARYTPGQVWRPKNVNPDDVNPRPLSSVIPTNGLIGCISADKKWLLATAWEPWQELFQGVIRCIHSDFRIGGLEPGESKNIRGKIYVTANDTEALLKRYQADFDSKP